MMMMLDALSLIAFAAAIVLLPLLSNTPSKPPSRLNEEEKEKAECSTSSDYKETSNRSFPPTPRASRDAMSAH
jgi:hypothetical protein